MNKLFIIQKDAIPVYKQELEDISNLIKDAKRINIENLTVERLIRVDVVISNLLPLQWRIILNGLKIVSITVDDINKSDETSDIVIDYLFENKRKLFCGKKFKASTSNNFDVQFKEIFNLISLLTWDTKFWGYNVAYLSSRHLSHSILYRINNFIKNGQIRLVEYLCDCHDKRSVSIAEKNGFQFKDIRLTYEKKLSNQQKNSNSDNIKFSLATEEHLPSLRKLSKDIYKDSRYYFDGNFERKKAIEFYLLWTEKAVKGEYDDECFIIEMAEEIVGFCTVKYQNAELAQIGLVGISGNHIGKGLGIKLLSYFFNEMFNKGIKFISVVTQGRNYAAQRLYQKAGFVSYTTELWYHKWNY